MSLLRADAGKRIYKVIPLDQPVREKAIQMFASHPIEEYRHGMLEFGSSVPDLVPAFRQLDLPVLGLCGGDDPYPDQPEVLAGMKNFREAPAIPGAGRFVHWERPKEFNAVVRAFLRSLSSRRDGTGSVQTAAIRATSSPSTSAAPAPIAWSLREGEPIRFGKALSTPPRFALGVLDAVRVTAAGMGLELSQLLARTRLFLHGSTVVDNAIFTRQGARTGLITTAGFEDTLLVTRGAYGRWSGQPEEAIKHPVASNRPQPLVPLRKNCRRARARRLQGSLRAAARRARCRGGGRTAARQGTGRSHRRVPALVVSQSRARAAHPHTSSTDLAPQVHVSISSEVAPAPGEYERTSATVIDAYVGRVTQAYLAELTQLLGDSGYGDPVLVMQGYGGLVPIAEAAARPVGMIECGPAAGVVGAHHLAGILGDNNVIAADMGGTTFKVGVIARTAGSSTRASRWSTAITTSRRRSTCCRSAPAAAASSTSNIARCAPPSARPAPARGRVRSATGWAGPGRR